MGREQSDLDTRSTSELDPAELTELLEEEDGERATVTIDRDELLGLLDQTVHTQAANYVHTVPRTARPRDALLDDLDINIRPSASPLLVLGILALLIALFVGVTRLG